MNELAASRRPSWVRDDLPRIWEDEELDEFGVHHIATRICDQIESTQVPFTISLSGQWGAGKSTVASAVVHLLQSRGGSACYIDAWTQDVDTLRRRLVTDVGAQMLLGRRDKVVHEAGWQRLREAENEAREMIAEFIDGRTKESTTTQTVQAQS